MEATASARKKLYSDLFPQVKAHEDEAAVDAEVIVIGAGIAGASIAHWCSSRDQSCRVIVLEQYDYSKATTTDDRDNDNNKGNGDTISSRTRFHSVIREISFKSKTPDVYLKGPLNKNEY